MATLEHYVEYTHENIYFWVPEGATSVFFESSCTDWTPSGPVWFPWFFAVDPVTGHHKDITDTGVYLPPSLIDPRVTHVCGGFLIDTTGYDGSLLAVEGSCHGFKFANLPNMYSFSPVQLLIPDGTQSSGFVCQPP
jgi:hypothetical protein